MNDELRMMNERAEYFDLLKKKLQFAMIVYQKILEYNFQKLSV